uniref:Uncharacterized protein n=1 Tax=Hemiselmis andersenii TaxID=464988 RepID=A0A6T8KQB8_HEMAN
MADGSVVNREGLRTAEGGMRGGAFRRQQPGQVQQEGSVRKVGPAPMIEQGNVVLFSRDAAQRLCMEMRNGLGTDWKKVRISGGRGSWGATREKSMSRSHDTSPLGHSHMLQPPSRGSRSASVELRQGLTSEPFVAFSDKMYPLSPLADSVRGLSHPKLKRARAPRGVPREAQPPLAELMNSHAIEAASLLRDTGPLNIQGSSPLPSPVAALGREKDRGGAALQPLRPTMFEPPTEVFGAHRDHLSTLYGADTISYDPMPVGSLLTSRPLTTSPDFARRPRTEDGAGNAWVARQSLSRASRVRKPPNKKPQRTEGELDDDQPGGAMSPW